MKMRSIMAVLLACCMLLPMTAFAAEAGTDVDLNQLAASYMEEIPEAAFGGMYYNESGQLVVNVKENSAVDIAVPFSDDVVVETVQYSLAELEAMKDCFEPYMQEYHIATLDANEVKNTVVIEVTKEDGGIYTLIENIDGVDADIVKVEVLPEDQVIESTVKYCDEIELGEIPEEFADLYENAGRAAAVTIYPGMKIYFEQASGYGQLTSGPRYSSTTFCSAGHGIYMGKTTAYCTTVTGGITSYSSIGTANSYTFGASGDRSFIRVSGTTSLPSSNSFLGKTGKYTISPNGITGTAVEMWGSNSGITSGKITATNMTVTVDGTSVGGLSKASYTCQGGDSGGGVFSSGVSTDSSGYCYGVQSAGTSKNSAGVYQISYFSPIS